MVVVVKFEDFPLLLEKLEPRLPECLPVYGIIQHGLDTDTEHRIAVNAWPEFTCVVVSLENSYYPLKGVTYYSTNHEDLRKLLNHPGVLGWDSALNFVVVCKSSHTILEDVCKQNGGQIKPRGQFATMVATEDSLNEFQLPEGYLLSELTESEAELVNSEWDYNIGDKTLTFVRHLIQTRPQVCIREQHTNIPVGYELTFEFSCMALLYVRPAYRGLGLAKVVVCNLAKKHLQNGRHAYCWIDVDNTASVNLHNKCGFSVVDDYDAIIMAYTPQHKADILNEITK